MLVYHTFEPIADTKSRILILGSLPSVKSREGNFYYHHPQNRFWKVINSLTNYMPKQPAPESIAEKKEMLLTNGIAIWDVIASCDITGSSDSSIKDVTANDIAGLLEKYPMQKIYTNGGKAGQLYDKYCLKETGVSCIKLPSTSPANAAWSLERLTEAWKVIMD
ncbi:MAG: DNA-deoxyinosine glycosylase [Lachnospiraceae bacterium]|nr:DNA-deoxyinosine glycosylase [Lachnospiraceae bacterium]